ncbi:hypothetical protein ACJVDK_09130 [Pedobacter sp. MW01-1-1]
MKNKNWLLIIIVLIVIVMFLKNLVINFWYLNTDENYFIPKESSIRTFEATQMNEGSGDWWLYGEDKDYYYGLNIETVTPRYYILKKGRETKNFDKLNYNKWGIK